LQANFLEMKVSAAKNSQPRDTLIPMENPTAWTQLVIRFFCRSMPRRHGTLERQSTQSALSIQQCGFSPTHAHQKNSGTLFCSFLLSEKLRGIFTKPLRFRFGIAICPILQLFF